MTIIACDMSNQIQGNKGIVSYDTILKFIGLYLPE